MASRRSSPFGPGLPLALLRFSPRHKSPPPGTARRAEALVVSVGQRLGASAKPWAGVRRQRHWAALRSAGARRARAQRALQQLTRADCLSGANAVSAASFGAPPRPEHRKGVGLQGRPPHTSAGAYPPAAL